MVLKIVDTLGWMYGVVPRAGLTFMDFYKEGPYGVWLVIAEILIFGIVPAIILLNPKARQNEGWLIAGLPDELHRNCPESISFYRCDPCNSGHAV